MAKQSRIRTCWRDFLGTFHSVGRMSSTGGRLWEYLWGEIFGLGSNLLFMVMAFLLLYQSTRASLPPEKGPVLIPQLQQQLLERKCASFLWTETN
jgi:hypothetical protein